jgi:hypothetical protein
MSNYNFDDKNFDYIFARDISTNIIPITTNYSEKTTDLGLIYKNIYNLNPSDKNQVSFKTNVNVISSQAPFILKQSNLISTSNSLGVGSVSMNSTGQYCIATYGSTSAYKLYYSSDYGATWEQSSFLTGDASAIGWTSISLSSKSSLAVACLTPGGIYVSNNYGRTYSIMTQASTSILWSYVAASSTGQYIFASSVQNLFYSNDYGNNWYSVSGTPQYSNQVSWTNVCISSTGQYGLAILNMPKTTTSNYKNPKGYIYYTSNYGVTWNKQSDTPNWWYTLCMSSTGQYCFATTNSLIAIIGIIPDSTVYYSTDYGHSWTQSNIANGNYSPIVISATGQYGLTSEIENNGDGDYVYIAYTNDYGVTWTIASTNYASFWQLAISANGDYCLAGSFGVTTDPDTYAGIYTIKREFTNETLDLENILQPINPKYWTISNNNYLFSSVSMTGSSGLGVGCVSLGNIYYTEDYGYSWTLSNSDNGNWSGISINNNSVLACINNGQIYMSTNYGIKWSIITSSPTENWTCISLSSNNTAIACIDEGSIYYSSNLSDWTKTNAPNVKWTSVALSDSKYAIACAKSQRLYISLTYGYDWNAISYDWNAISNNKKEFNWTSVAISKSGQYMVACSDGDGIYSSIDYGYSWNRINSNTYSWSGISISSNGQFIIACSQGEEIGNIYYSNDYGSNWNSCINTTLGNWTSLSISETGQFGLASSSSSSSTNSAVYVYYLTI